MAFCRLLHSEVVYTVKPRLKRTPHYYRQFPLSLGEESLYIFSEFNPLTPLIRTLFMTPPVSVLEWFDRTTPECKTCLVDMINLLIHIGPYTEGFFTRSLSLC